MSLNHKCLNPVPKALNCKNLIYSTLAPLVVKLTFEAYMYLGAKVSDREIKKNKVPK